MKAWFASVRRSVTRRKPRTLFAWFLTGFAAIILLFGSFTLFSVLFFSDRVKDEVIRYNNLILASATADYEKQFQLIHDAMLLFSMNVNVEKLNGEVVDYQVAQKTLTDIRNFLNNSTLRIDNLILHFAGNGFTLDISKGVSNNAYFTRYLHHPSLQSPDWISRFGEHETVTIMPAATISEFDGNGNQIAQYRRMPIVVRNLRVPDFAMIALVDADAMYDSFFRSVNDNFYIRDASGRLLYSPANAVSGEAAADLVREADGRYVFQRTGAFTDFTYTTVISDDNFAAKTRWESSFIALLVIVVAICAVMSLVFSSHLQSPVRRMVEALRRQDAGDSRLSHIKEFSEIQEQVQRILQSNQAIHRDLTTQQTILRQYAVLDEIKKTRNRLNRYREMQEVQAPFRILLFQVHYSPHLRTEYGISKEKATPYIKEIIDYLLLGAFPETLSLQVESDLIISVLFGPTSDEQTRAVADDIVDMMRNEGEYCFLTVVIGAARPENGDLTEAYEAAVELHRRRTFDSPNQILVEPLEITDYTCYTLAREDEFDRLVASGERDAALDMIDKQLRQMRKRQARHTQVIDFAYSLAIRIENGCARTGFETQKLHDIRAELDQCHTYEQLKTWFTKLVGEAAGMYDAQRIKRDPIIAFVCDYIETNYASVISLDLLADKLDISRSYLSTYFKEKTGMYFVDYVNSVRIRNVLPLLIKPGVKIQDAAADVGYQNINSFNRIFKKMTGTTPSEYRLNALAEAAIDRSRA